MQFNDNNIIEAVLHQTVSTFYSADDGFDDRLAGLNRLLNQLTVTDVGLDLRLLRNDVHRLNADPDQPSAVRHRLTPITYINVFKHELVHASLYVLRNRAKIPFHDHPIMYGLIKALHGEVKVQSYNPMTPALEYDRTRASHINAVKLPPVVIGPNDYANLLGHFQGNIHQVEAVNGPVAYFELLVPPYKPTDHNIGQRRCRFFKETPNNAFQLTVVGEDDGYLYDEAPYTGLQVNSCLFK